jgi:hypothetical protein
VNPPDVSSVAVVVLADFCAAFFALTVPSCRRREGEGDVAARVGGHALPPDELFVLVGARRIQEELDFEGLAG